MLIQFITYIFSQDDTETEVTVSARYTPPGGSCARNFSRFQEPDDDAEIEIESVTDANGRDYLPLLSKKALARIEEEAYESAIEAAYEYAD
jgi:hypothetical protein